MRTSSKEKGSDSSIPGSEPQPRRSWLQRIRDWLWGYDFFVSYHWASGGLYAVNLAQRLRDAKYDVFLDRAEYAMGDDWKKVGGHALANTQRLILVATREAVTDSEPVVREVRLFTGRNRQLIPIAFGDDLQGLDWNASDVLRRLEDSRLRITEDTGSLSGGPSDQTVDKLVRTHGLMRRRTLRRWIISVLITLISVSALLAGLQWQVAVEEARKANLQLAKTLMRQGIYERDEKGDFMKASHYLFRAAAAGAKAREPRLSTNGRIAGNIAAKRLPTRWLGFEYRGRVHKVLFDEDEQWLLTLGEDEAWIWDIRTGEPLSGPIVHTGIKGAQFGKDRTRLLTWGGKHAQIWDSRTGTALAEPMVLDSGMAGAEFSIDDRLVFAWGGAAVQVWDSESGKALSKHSVREHPIRGAVLSRDNRRVLIRTDYEVQVWDRQKGNSVLDSAGVGSYKSAEKLKKALFSPDQKRVLIWTPRGARLLDGYTGEPTGSSIPSPPLPPRHLLKGAVFSGERQLVMTWSEATRADMHVAQVWDGVTGEPLSKPMNHPGLKGARFSQDQRYVLTWSMLSAQVWEIRTGKSVTGPMVAEREIQTAVFSHDQKWVLTREHTPWTFWGQASIWDSLTGKLLSGPMVHEKGIAGAKLSADQSRLLTWGSGRAQIWDTHTGKPLTGCYNGARGAMFSADESRVLTWREGVAQVWDSRPPGNRPDALTPKKISGTVLSADGKRLLTWGGDRAQVRDNATYEPLSALMEHENLVGGASFSADTTRVLTWDKAAGGQKNGAAYVWDSRMGERLIGPLKQARIKGAVFSRDQQWLMTWGGEDWGRRGTANIWNSRTGKLVSGPIVREKGIDGVEFSADRQRLLTWGGGTAQIWDSRKGEPLGESILHAGIAKIKGARFSDDQSRVVTWGTTWYTKDSHLIPRGERDPGSVQVWDSGTGKPVSGVLKHPGVKDVRFSQDARRLLTWGVNHARIWDLRPGAKEACEIEQQGIQGAVFSQDERRVLTWGHAVNAAAQVWDVRDCNPGSKPMRHEKGVVGARFSQDDQRVLTWGEDGTARVWDSQTGDPQLTPMAHFGALDVGLVSGKLAGAVFSPDGHRVLTWSGGLSGDSVRLWDSHNGEPLSLDPSEYGAPLLRRVATGRGEQMLLIWRSGHRSLLEGGEISGLIADLDFPHEHLTLRLEVKTGRRLTDIGDVEDLMLDDWKARWAAYEPLAREHLKKCRCPQANWYLDRMLHRPGSCERPGDWLDQVNPATLDEVKEMYASVCLQRGRRHLAEGRHREARRHFETARILQPSRASADAELARSLIESDDDPSKDKR